MRKLIILLLSSMFVFAQASAVGLKVGVAGVTGVFHATGQENENGEVHTEDATGVVGYSAVFAEVQLNDMFGIGIDYVPGDLTSETAETTLDDLKGSGDGASSKSTNSVALSFEDITQIYATLNLGENLYVKAGILTVDVITNESMGTGSTYDNTDMEGDVFGIGYDRELDNGLFFRIEGQYMELEDKSLTASNNSENTVSLKAFEGASARIAIGKAF